MHRDANSHENVVQGLGLHAEVELLDPEVEGAGDTFSDTAPDRVEAGVERAGVGAARRRDLDRLLLDAGPAKQAHGFVLFFV